MKSTATATRGTSIGTAEAVAETRGSAMPVELGQPITHKGLTLVPMFGAEHPRVEFVSLAKALAEGLSVEEVDDAGAVRWVTVRNALACAVLLYEGEAIAGAKQDRVFVRPVLVPEYSEADVPVFCVERGRWSYRSQRFTASPCAASPTVRRAGSIVGQAGVWKEVQAKMECLGVSSETHAASALYGSLNPLLDAFFAAFPRRHGQCGAMVWIRGRIVCLDYVSRPEVHADVYAKLLRGYGLDAIAGRSAETVPEDASEASEEFLAEVAATKREPVRTVGRGELRRVVSTRLIGWELRVAGELIALSIVRR